MNHVRNAQSLGIRWKVILWGLRFPIEKGVLPQQYGSPELGVDWMRRYFKENGQRVTLITSSVVWYQTRPLS